jgi:hypothetical protein
MGDVERDAGVEGEGGGFENLKFKMSRGYFFNYFF